MAVYVKAVTYKGKPFFFVRMQFGKGSERKELCGPRHVTEEAAKRDKESLDGKPIDEQLAGVASLDLLSHATQAEVFARWRIARSACGSWLPAGLTRVACESRCARKARLLRKARWQKARREAESSSARAARLLINARREKARRLLIKARTAPPKKAPCGVQGTPQ